MTATETKPTKSAKKPTAKKPPTKGDAGTGNKDVMKVNGKEVYKPNENMPRMIPLSRIVTNDPQHRAPARRLFDLGYGLFEKPKDSNKPYTLREMALSADPVLRGEFITLIETYESWAAGAEGGEEGENDEIKFGSMGITRLAESILMIGQIHPVSVRVVTEGEHAGDYDLIAGARRYLSLLYMSAKRQENYPIRAVVTTRENEAARSLSLDENLTVQGLSKAELIQAIRQEYRLTNSVAQVAKKFGLNERTAERRLDCSYAGEELLNQLDRGEVGITDVETIGRAVKGGKSLDDAKKILSRPSRRANKKKDGGKAIPPVGISRKAAWKMFTTDSTVHEQVRAWVAQTFWFPYKTFEQMQVDRDNGETFAEIQTDAKRK